MYTIIYRNFCKKTLNKELNKELNKGLNIKQKIWIDHLRKYIDVSKKDVNNIMKKLPKF